jgi:hypothetical protein
MNLFRLVVREIGFRKLNFLLGVLSVAVAVGCLIAAIAFLQEHRLLTDRIVAEKEAAMRERLVRYEDEVRKLTKNMGFNILILPRGLDLGRVYLDGAADRFMPEAYAGRLAESGVVTINHVLPSLQQRMRWPERDRTVFVMGVRGEVWIKKEGQKPLLEPVPAGTIWLGYELHREVGVKRGDRIPFMGRAFRVMRCQPERGSKDDVTVWMNLADAQSLLERPGQINAILALECSCVSVDRVADVRREVARILPDTQVIEYQSQALARAEARKRAAALAREEIAREKANRRRLAREKETMAAAVVPLTLVACAIWIGFLAWSNVRERRTEIGILRALGVGSGQVLVLFLSKAVLMGLLGAGVGYASGLLFAGAWNPAATMSQALRGMARPVWMIAVLAAAPILAAAACWIPALWATRQDPAVVLREE